MRLVVVAIAFVAGCFPKTYHCTTNADCGASGTCEPIGFCAYADSSCAGGLRFGDLSGASSQQCVAQVDAGSDGRPDADLCAIDTDGDGIPDCRDNCPTVANPGQENDDGDRFGDVCDPCPPIADDNPPDTDGDGVADACDPRPTTSGDRIALFEGFSHGVPASWESNGTWMVVNNDDVRTSATNPPNTLAVASATSTHETVSTAIVLNSVVGGQINAVGVLDDHQLGTTSSVGCSIYIANGFTPSPGLSVFDSQNIAGAMTTAYQMNPGTTYTFQLRRDATVYSCVVDDGAGGTATVTNTITTVRTPYASGVSVGQADATVKWLMVVTN